MGYVGATELAWRLHQEIFAYGGSLPEATARAMVAEWAPGRVDDVIEVAGPKGDSTANGKKIGAVLIVDGVAHVKKRR